MSGESFVVALDAENGEEIWRKNLVQDYKTKIPPWYNGQNPLLGKDGVIVAPAGMIVCFFRCTSETTSACISSPTRAERE